MLLSHANIFRYRPRGGSRLITVLVTCSLILALYLMGAPIPMGYHLWRHDLVREELIRSAGNSTLGFGCIYALSSGVSWRVNGLRAAASQTGLSITIPSQENISEKRLQSFLTAGPAGQPRPGKGSAIAWLAHLDLLQRVVDGAHETALILEDDADWDVSIKEQVSAVSEGMQTLARREATLISSVLKRSSTSPYGRRWDILWIGHCGENVGPAMISLRSGKDVPLALWHDSTAIPRSKYTGWAHNAVMELPGFSRALQPAVGPVCTFAYGITRTAASSVVKLAGQATNRAFDVMLASLCLNKRLTCYTVTPELMHEYVPLVGRDGKTASEVNAANGEGDIANDGSELEERMGSTANIVRSARCRALFGSNCLPDERAIDD